VSKVFKNASTCTYSTIDRNVYSHLYIQRFQFNALHDSNVKRSLQSLLLLILSGTGVWIMA
jgi:hypothetical protein